MNRNGDLKYASGWVIVHGLMYIISTVKNIHSKSAFRFGINEYSDKLWYIGIVFGAILLSTGLGILYKKEKAHKIAVLIYKFLILQKVAIWVYVLVTVGFEPGVTYMLLVLLITDLVLLKIVKNVKTEII